MKTKDLIAEAISLPVEERAVVVESILNSLNPPDPVVDKKWVPVAKQRLSELNSSSVEAVPGDEVFNRIWDRLST